MAPRATTCASSPLASTRWHSRRLTSSRTSTLSPSARPGTGLGALARVAASMEGSRSRRSPRATGTRHCERRGTSRWRGESVGRGARTALPDARVVALPVRDNAYSGATTTLLQAMALAKPVVVSRTAAIADGYWLEDGTNVRLVPPGDDAAFCGGERAARRAGRRGRARPARARDGRARARLGALRRPARRRAAEPLAR